MTKTYSFRVGTETQTFQAESRVNAMVLANAHFKAYALPQGAWMDCTGGYYWAEGNFFD